MSKEVRYEDMGKLYKDLDKLEKFIKRIKEKLLNS